MDYTIREIQPNEYKILEEFSYEAIFIPDGVESPPKTIVEQPELQIYIREFGKKDDNALLAECEGKRI